MEAWKGERRLSTAQLAELVRLVEAQGWWVDQRGGNTSIQGRGGEEIDCEEFSFDAAGGWLSKPSSDCDEAETQMELAYTICEYAGWVVYDPQSNEIIYGLAMTCPRCGFGVSPGNASCPLGHPATEAKVELTVEPPEEIPDEEEVSPKQPDFAQFRHFRHPDGRQWSIRAAGRKVELVIVLPDGERIERTRSAIDGAAARADVDERIKSQCSKGFVEGTA